MQDFSSLPYRPCVGIMLINEEGLIWVGQRVPKQHDLEKLETWQMPQGGIDDGEKPEDAARRELEEETGISSIEIIAEAKDWLTYDLPDALLGRVLKGRYKGQRQKWFAMRFLGNESEINISAKEGHGAEFEAWRWVEIEELPRLVISFKQSVYEQVIAEFKGIVRPI